VRVARVRAQAGREGLGRASSRGRANEVAKLVERRGDVGLIRHHGPNENHVLTGSRGHESFVDLERLAVQRQSLLDRRPIAGAGEHVARRRVRAPEILRQIQVGRLLLDEILEYFHGAARARGRALERAVHLKVVRMSRIRFGETALRFQVRAHRRERLEHVERAQRARQRRRRAVEPKLEATLPKVALCQRAARPQITGVRCHDRLEQRARLPIALERRARLSRIRLVHVPLNVADLLVRCRELELQSDVVGHFGGERVQVLERRLDEQCARVRRARQVLDRIVHIEHEHVGEAAYAREMPLRAFALLLC
jgi:hypothetical protein